MKRIALLFGFALLAAGIAGFVPALCPEGLLFGLFAVDPAHNILHIATGIFGIAMAMAGEAQSVTYLRLVGIVYLVLAGLGMVSGRGGELMGMAHNIADIWLHAGIAALALALGFLRGSPALPPGGGKGPDLRGI
jgi:hypothetical protein